MLCFSAQKDHSTCPTTLISISKVLTLNDSWPSHHVSRWRSLVCSLSGTRVTFGQAGLQILILWKNCNLHWKTTCHHNTTVRSTVWQEKETSVCSHPLYHWRFRNVLFSSAWTGLLSELASHKLLLSVAVQSVFQVLDLLCFIRKLARLATYSPWPSIPRVQEVPLLFQLTQSQPYYVYPEFL